MEAEDDLFEGEGEETVGEDPPQGGRQEVGGEQETVAEAASAQEPPPQDVDAATRAPDIVPPHDPDPPAVPAPAQSSSTSTSLSSAGAKRKINQTEQESPCVRDPKSARRSAEAEAAAENEDEDEGAVCTICMEAWTNSGEHRIASLRCGHFFGHSCIDRWLRGGGGGCPNCNEKSTRRDIRPHYISKLKAIDTSERDRALADLERARKDYRTLEQEHSILKAKLGMQAAEMEKLKKDLRRALSGAVDLSSAASALSSAGVEGEAGLQQHQHRLTYVRKIELVRSTDASGGDKNRCCRVMAYSDFHGMLVVSQPSFTALAPGFGVRKINMLEQKAGAFISLHKEPIRDLAFNQARQDQLLSASQDKCVKLTNISTGQVMQKYPCDAEVWACCWSAEDSNAFFAGTKRSQILAFDTRSPHPVPKRQIEFPDRLPIIGLCHVPKVQMRANRRTPSCPAGGLLVLTLNSVWFLEEVPPSAGEEEGQQSEYRPHKLSVEGPFWSARFDPDTRLALISTKPRPHSSHLVVDIARVEAPAGENAPSYVANVLFSEKRGGAYSERSFLRSAMSKHPDNENQLVLLYGKGTGQIDQRVAAQEVGSEKPLHECPVPKPVLDIASPVVINRDNFAVFLCEAEILLYKWTRAD